MPAVWARARAELRSGWRRGIGLALLMFASQQRVVAQPRVPIGAIVLVVPAAIALAGLVAAVPARVASLVKPALVLRAE